MQARTLVASQSISGIFVKCKQEGCFLNLWALHGSFIWPPVLCAEQGLILVKLNFLLKDGPPLPERNVVAERAGRLDFFLLKKSLLRTLPFRVKSSDIIDRTTNGVFDGSIITWLQCRGSCTDVMDVCINFCHGIKNCH